MNPNPTGALDWSSSSNCNCLGRVMFGAAKVGLDLLGIVDVGRRADPLMHGAHRRHESGGSGTACQRYEPVESPDAKIAVIRRLHAKRHLPHSACMIGLVGMHERQPVPAADRLGP